MKARKVKRLDPDAPLLDGARKIVSVRLGEVDSFVPTVTAEDDVQALHDMRIAFKRLRYVLEVMEPCFGEPAGEAISSTRRYQDLLGAIHDCDVMVPMVEGHLERLRAEDLIAVRAASDGNVEPDPNALRTTPNRTRYRGLETAATYFRARRELLYRRLMHELEGDGWGSFKASVEAMAGSAA